ncbi:hypothetical protein [Mycobacterium branderi]|uniref:Uncharacterized protein n=1 Tax=Mycobacterium branderi TaxID=43348 RepID=A0AA91M056_9MYCO|nr:hypothetical protein [Mycobacterium branderi]MCV7231718.1 hypothetical protein [Mycobacterium branderi]ORA40311.1 hypothetical protein BST20_07115 [Mycobacterium branderi]
MTIKDIGPLLGADEALTHQIIDTFAVLSQSDYTWTEKIWASIARSDGALQIDFGLGKYQNRGIIDGFGGVSRGSEQWTVRASRELRLAPEEMTIGPVRYEIIEPLRKVRFVLEPNDVQPISFDVVLSGVTPPFFEDRNFSRNPASNRVDMNVVRYHQGGWTTGTVTIDGHTEHLGEGEWFGFRDHSWGVRQGIGDQPRDLIAGPITAAQSGRSMLNWMPAFFRRPDGSHYETAVFLLRLQAWTMHGAYINDAQGRQTPARSVDPRLRYDPRTRVITGGELILTMDDGEQRVIEVERLGGLGGSGFFLKTAGYGNWAGFSHGSWKGPLEVSGEHIADCLDDEHLAALGQFRDNPVRVRDGDAVGYGILESVIRGVWPELGLTAESDWPEGFG